MWQNLKTKLVAFLSANTLIQQVYDYEAVEFSGDPAVTIMPVTNEAGYRTTIHNKRIYAFKLEIWVKRGDVRTDKEAEDVLTGVVDSVLDDFDKYYTLGTGSPGAALVLPTGYSMIMVEALNGPWGYANRETLYRVAEITIRCVIDVDVTLIS